jgi:hypothetical protein
MTQQDNAQPISLDAVAAVTGEPEPDQGAAYPPIPNSRAVPLRNIHTWIADAWRLFKQRPGAWLAFALFCAGIAAGIPVVTSNVIFTCVFLTFFHVFFVGWAANLCDLNLRKQGSAPFWSFLVIRRHLPDLSPSHGKSGLAQIRANLITNAGFSPSHDKSGLVGTFYYILEILFSPLLIIALHRLAYYYVLANVFFADLVLQFFPFTLSDMFSQLSSSVSINSPEMMYAWAIFIVGISICDMWFFFYPVLVMLHNITLLIGDPPPSTTSYYADRISWSAVRKNIPSVLLLYFMTNILLIGTIAFISHQLAIMPVSMHFTLSCTCVVLIFFLYTFMLICSYTAYRNIFFDSMMK